MPGKILIIDGIATNRIGLRARLCSAYYEVAQAASGGRRWRCCRSSAPIWF